MLLAQRLGQVLHLHPENNSSDETSLPPGNLVRIFVELSLDCLIDEERWIGPERDIFLLLVLFFPSVFSRRIESSWSSRLTGEPAARPDASVRSPF